MTKIFISYSHKDESYLEDLTTHLATFRRGDFAIEWHDRKLIAGQTWEEEIHKELESSDIIIFLVSADFINSDYCYSIEAKRALEKHDARESTLIPVIIRHCDWQPLPFAKIQGCPKDGKPVNAWADKDEAYLDIVKRIRRSITQQSKPADRTESTQAELIEQFVHEDFLKFTRDTDIVFQHRNVEKIYLDQIFTYPDLKNLEETDEKRSGILHSSKWRTFENQILIFGAEQSGKTGLCKTILTEAINEGINPIYLNGSQIASSDFDKTIDKANKSLYKNPKGSKSLLVIDDFESIRTNRKAANTFLHKAKSQFTRIFIFSNEGLQLNLPEYPELNSFKKFELLPFSRSKRNELIKKWICLGNEDQITAHALIENLDSLNLHIESLIQNSILPSTPIFLLSLIQTFENFSPQRLELSSYGHCYQYLLYQSFERAGVRQREVDSYTNFLTELAGWMYSNEHKSCEMFLLDKFTNEYNKNFISIDLTETLDKLTICSILQKTSSEYSFKHRYLYYFFASKHLAESFSKDTNTKIEIQKLIQGLHRTESANLLIFITHHSKDPWVIDEIILQLMELFSENTEATLKRESLSFIKDIFDEVPSLVLEARDYEEEREQHAKRNDNPTSQPEEDKGEEYEQVEFLADINRVMKGIEIVGQILRNRFGSLKKETMITMVEESFNVSMRLLDFYLRTSEEVKELVIDVIKAEFSKNPNFEMHEAEKKARQTFRWLIYGGIFGIIKKTSSALGAKEAREIYKSACDRIDTPAVQLVDLSIELQCNKSIRMDRIESLLDRFSQNPLTKLILKQLVINHVYFHPIDYKDKQRIAEKLDIPIAKQRMIRSAAES